jgi:hypothetical protein
MFKKSAPVLFLGAVMLAVSCASMAQGKGGGTKGGQSVVPTVAGSGNVSAESLIQRYTPMAGTVENATSLVNGLRDSTEITLSITVVEKVKVQVGTQTIYVDQRVPAPPPAPPGTFIIIKVPQTVPIYGEETRERVETEKFTSPTGAMGLGNVDVALALTDALLTQQGVTKPATPKQLRAALVGDNNILQLRAKGMGWGDIAKSLGFELK